MDHKYLLELVENKCAIAFFAATNRNQSLYNALVEYHFSSLEDQEYDEDGNRIGGNVIHTQYTKATGVTSKKPGSGNGAVFGSKKFLEGTFCKMMEMYDFMSLVMYPELKNRREFIHDCWIIAKATENDELKYAISNDPYFYITRVDILHMLRTHDNKMIAHILDS